MRWLILTDDHPPALGGVSTFTGAVTHGLLEAGHEVRTLARSRPGLPPHVEGVSGPSFSRRGVDWVSAAAWRPRQLRAPHHLIGWSDQILATTWPVAPRRLAARLHLVAHGSDVTRPTHDPRRRARVWARAQSPWAMSAFLAQRVAPWTRARVLPAPIDPQPHPRAPGDGLSWLFIGRAVPRKGGARFVRLCAAAGARGTVVGAGPRLGAWARLARQLGAQIRFLGALPPPTIQQLLPAHDLLCLLPHTSPQGDGAEGLGLVLLEAAAHGLAVVGTRVGGVPEAVGPGLLLEHPEDPERSAAALRSWWRPDRGAQAWAWLRAHHGVQRTVTCLVQASGAARGASRKSGSQVTPSQP